MLVRKYFRSEDSTLIVLLSSLKIEVTMCLAVRRVFVVCYLPSTHTIFRFHSSFE